MMRTTVLLRRLHALRMLHMVPQNSGPVARPMRVADAGAMGSSRGFVRFMGVGSFKEGNRASQHGAKYPQTKPDGSPEKAESDARNQFLERVKKEAAAGVDPGESGRSGGEATTELEFGVKDGKNTTEAISNASDRLFKQSTINANSEMGPIREEDKRKYPEHQRADAFSEKNKEGGAQGRDAQTTLPDDSRTDEAMLADDSHADEATGSGERARENIEKTRSEMRAGKARSPQAGVIVGNVASAGANALENKDDVPENAVEWERTGDEALDKAQKSYEEAIAGFGTRADRPNSS